MPNSPNALFRTIAAALLLALALSGCDAGNQTTDAEHVAKAQEYRDQGELKKSVIELNNALQKNPDNAEAHRLRAEIAVEFGNGEAAEGELKRAVELGVPREAMLLTLSQALLLQGKYQDLLDRIAVPETVSGQDGARLMAGRGDAWLGLDKPDKARADYEAGLLLDGSSALAKLGLARLALAGNDPGQASRLLGEALASEPGNAALWSFQGGLREAEGQPALAEESYTQAIALRWRNQFDRARRAWVRLAQNQLDAAREDVEALKKQVPNYFLTHYAQGLLLFREQKLPEAQAEFEETLKLNPGFAEALYFQGVVHFLQGRLLHAQESLARFNALAPDSVQGQTMMALVKFKQGDPEEAAKTLAPVVERFPGNVPALRLMGNIALARGDQAGALGYLGKAVEASARAAAAKPTPGGDGKDVGEVEAAMAADPALAQMEIQIVLIHLRERKYSEALEAIEGMKRRMPGSALPFALLAQVYAAQGALGKAQAALQEALKVAPNDLGTLQTLAKLAIKDKQYAAARRYCQAALEARPGNLPSQLCLADLDNLEGRPAAMADQLKQALQDHPDALPPRLALAGAYSRLGQAARGLSLLEQARDQFKDRPEFLERLAEAQLENRQAPQALETADLLIKLEPAAARGEYLSALAQGEQGRLPNMRSALERALRKEPKSLPARAAWVRLLAIERNVAEADSQLKLLLKDYPDHPQALSLKGWLAFKEHQWSQAESAYRQALARFPASAVAADLARSQWFAGDREGALKTLNDWSGQHPEDAGTRYLLAGYYGEMGRKQEQRAQFEQAIAANPNDLLALNDLAWELRAEQPERALGYAERAVKLAPDSAPVLDTLAAILIEQGRPGEALALLEGGRQRWPDSSLIRYRLAVAQDRQGGSAEAVKTLRDLLAGSRDFPERKDAEALLGRLTGR
jgi:putative PEP-CTERM system TPR-repeat lipoprotein